MFECDKSAVQGFHSMAIVGYGEENGIPYWIVKNSWGPRYGLGGYLKMKRGVNACGLANAVYTAVIKN